MTRFKEFTIELIYEQHEGMGVKDLFPAKISIDLNQVESFREQSPDESKELTLLCVYMKSGESFVIVDCDYYTFKSLIKQSVDNFIVMN